MGKVVHIPTSVFWMLCLWLLNRIALDSRYDAVFLILTPRLSVVLKYANQVLDS